MANDEILDREAQMLASLQALSPDERAVFLVHLGGCFDRLVSLLNLSPEQVAFVMGTAVLEAETTHGGGWRSHEHVTKAHWYDLGEELPVCPTQIVVDITKPAPARIKCLRCEKVLAARAERSGT